MSESSFGLAKFIICFCIGMFLASCQSPRPKIDYPQTSVPPKSIMATDGSTMNRRKPNRQIKQHNTKLKTQAQNVYCEGDFLDYSQPQTPFLGLTLQFVYDQRKTIEMIFLNDEEKIIQRLIFKVNQKESLKLAKAHGNQTILARHPEGLQLPGFPTSKKIMALLPLSPVKDVSSQPEAPVDVFGTLNFQNSKNEFVGGNQKLICTFDP